MPAPTRVRDNADTNTWFASEPMRKHCCMPIILVSDIDGEISQFGTIQRWTLLFPVLSLNLGSTLYVYYHLPGSIEVRDVFQLPRTAVPVQHSRVFQRHVLTSVKYILQRQIG
jgi:hypothetical protein